MNIDEEEIDKVVLALLQLTVDGQHRAWKQFDFGIMNRLHEKGYILDPVNKNKSVVLTDKGLEHSQELFRQYFQKDDLVED